MAVEATDPSWMVFDHLGVVVRDIAAARAGLAQMLGIRDWTAAFADPVNRVTVQFGRDGSGVNYELIEPLGDDSPVIGALNSRRAILNHVAYRVAALGEHAERLQEVGCIPITPPRPAIAYGGRMIQFFANQLHFVIELIEAPDHQHQFLALPFGDTSG